MGNKVCQWTPEEEDCEGNWETDCGHYFTMIDGTPLENSMAFCCFCGSVIEEVEWEEEKW